MKRPEVFRSQFFVIITLMATSFATTSCSEEEVDPVVITVDDAAELVAFSMANRTYGTVYNLNYVAEEVTESIFCNEVESRDESFSEDSRDGEITVTLDISESYTRSCDPEDVVQYSFMQSQSLTSIRFDREQTVDGTWFITATQGSFDIATYNGPYTSQGEWTYNLEDDHTDQITYNTTMMDVTYDGSLERITGGSATFSLEGKSTVYEDYLYTGDIEFLGSDLSIITFSSGEQYELNLETGEITPLES